MRKKQKSQYPIKHTRIMLFPNTPHQKHRGIAFQTFAVHFNASSPTC